jgi:hypothetical protein
MSKIRVFFALLTVSVILIVLPVVRPVNVPDGNRAVMAPAPVAEGDPMPLPHKPRVSVLVAEGDPMPLPHKPRVSVLVAEGDPMPLPHKPRLA